MNKYFADGYLFCAPAGATRFVSVMKLKVITTYILKFRMLRRYRKIEVDTIIFQSSFGQLSNEMMSTYAPNVTLVSITMFEKASLLIDLACITLNKR